MEGYHKANFAIPLKGLALFTADRSLRTLYSPLGHSKLHVVQEFEMPYKINASLCPLCTAVADCYLYPTGLVFKVLRLVCVKK